jgi:hypothetical protein
VDDIVIATIWSILAHISSKEAIYINIEIDPYQNDLHQEQPEQFSITYKFSSILKSFNFYFEQWRKIPSHRATALQIFSLTSPRTWDPAPALSSVMSPASRVGSEACSFPWKHLALSESQMRSGSKTLPKSGTPAHSGTYQLLDRFLQLADIFRLSANSAVATLNVGTVGGSLGLSFWDAFAIILVVNLVSCLIPAWTAGFGMSGLRMTTFS